ncbi:hypothetical protein C1645_809248 [Glomus cerebriforme]|uniref:Uncharacterized protein n=1 Tax=Glomus cerebriforme TaxID=658196 RepID=A0A397SEU3_9GLOM|nr:hypothetical protein C1645_809248 [Glomus cerebriforme]
MAVTFSDVDAGVASNQKQLLNYYRSLWWRSGEFSSKAKWKEVTLPYVLVDDVSLREYELCTDRFNIHGMWEWKDNKFEFGTHDGANPPNQLNILPGMCLINIDLNCLYHQVYSGTQIPALPDPIVLDFHQISFLAAWTLEMTGREVLFYLILFFASFR